MTIFTIPLEYVTYKNVYINCTNNSYNNESVHNQE